MRDERYIRAARAAGDVFGWYEDGTGATNPLKVARVVEHAFSNDDDMKTFKVQYPGMIVTFYRDGCISY